MTQVIFDDVTFTYPESRVPALEHVSLTVPSGEFVLVVGHTGSSKSTLLRAVNGLVPHFTGGVFSGSVHVDGRDTREVAPRELSDVVAFVPQDPAASFVLDRVEDELAYAMENLGVPPKTMRRRVEETLDLLDIASLRDRSVHTLSGGERQRVAIAAALTPGCSILVLDEPTSQLDPQGAEEVLAALQRLAHDIGVTVICAEHRLDRVAGLADLVVSCDAGRVRSGPPSELLPELDLGPPVTQLAVKLGWHPAPLTVRDARRVASGIDLPRYSSRPATPMHEVLAVARGLTVRYDSTIALKAVDLEVGRGEVVAVLGRNGAGKTTLLRSLAGLQQPSAGSVLVAGARPEPGDTAALCPQEPDALLFAETVQGEIDATLGVHEGPTAESWLGRAGLGSFAARHPRDLSAGERALLAVASIAATEADLLLLDEPTRGLDVSAKKRLARLIEDIASRGSGVIVATHDVEFAAGLAHRVVMLAGGEIIGDGSPEEELARSPVFSTQIARVFDGRWLTVDQAVAGLSSTH